MQINQLITPASTFNHVPAGNKTDLLHFLADQANMLIANSDRQTILDGLQARERLGSTGVGEGVAIPHCRLPCCIAPSGILLTLAEPIEFGSLDSHPVDLVFALVTPADNAEDHLKVLSQLATLFNHSDYRQALRQANDTDSLYQQAIAPLSDTQPV